jgi:hypothetical protein
MKFFSYKPFWIWLAVVVFSTVLVSGALWAFQSSQSVSQQSGTGPAGTPAHQAEIAINNAQYVPVELENVESYAKTHTATSANNFVVTSGTVVGINKRIIPYELVLSDNKSSYVIVTFARAHTDPFAPIFSTLNIGDIVEVRGMVNVTRGVIVDSPDGKALKIEGVNLAHAPSFGVISLSGITKIE